MKEKTAIIFDIQRFSIHDGPGIRTAVFFKGCPLRCVWCQNPESHLKNPQIAWYAESCSGCMSCKGVCPQKAVRKGKKRIDFSLCNNCGKCAAVCGTGSLRMIGREITAESLTDEIIRDRSFYDESGGGITLSGGEPFVYHEFLHEFLPLVKNEGVHVTAETCGLFSMEEAEPLFSFIDLVYFDLKIINTNLHLEYTGSGNRKIAENFRCLVNKGTDVQARIPIVPGINDSAENLEKTAAFLCENGLKSIHCLPYHRLGESKLGRIDTSLMPLGINESGNYEYVKEIFMQSGIDAVFY